MPSPRVLAAIGTVLLVFSSVTPNLLIRYLSTVFGKAILDVLTAISLMGLTLWVFGNILNYFAWKGLAGGKDTLIGLLFIISALIHLQPIIMIITMLFLPLPFGIPPFEFVWLAVYLLFAFGYFKVGYGLTRM